MPADLKYFKGIDSVQDNKMPNSVQWRSEHCLVSLFCTCRSKIRQARTSLREGGIYVGSPYDLLAGNVKKALF